jgi:hypothetical protein
VQGQWVGRSTAPPGYRTLGTSRGSVGTGSAGSSRRGSTAALGDEFAAEAQQQQQQQWDAARHHTHYQQPQPGGGGAAAPAAPASSACAAAAAAAAAPEDEAWGKVEELLSQQQRDYSVLVPEEVRTQGLCRVWRRPSRCCQLLRRDHAARCAAERCAAAAAWLALL